MFEMLLHLNNLIQSLWNGIVYFIQVLYKLHVVGNSVVLGG